MNRLFLTSLLSVLFLGLGQADLSDYEDCQNGTRQSPIDIKDCDAVYDATKADVEFNWTRGDEIINVTLNNDGESVFLSSEFFTEHTVLDSGKFFVEDIVVHWGRPGQKGSQHTVDGGKYDGELEILLSKENSTFDEKDGDSIIVSIFLQEDSTLAKDIQIINDFKASLKAVLETHSSLTIQFTEKTLSLSSLLPTDQSFYRYSGSLSIEPCEESVERIVFKEPIKVTSSFFAELRKLKNEDGDLLESSVHRALQEDNGRVIYKSWE